MPRSSSDSSFSSSLGAETEAVAAEVIGAVVVTTAANFDGSARYSLT